MRQKWHVGRVTRGSGGSRPGQPPPAWPAPVGSAPPGHGVEYCRHGRAADTRDVGHGETGRRAGRFRRADHRPRHPAPAPGPRGGLLPPAGRRGGECVRRTRPRTGFVRCGPGQPERRGLPPAVRSGQPDRGCLVGDKRTVQTFTVAHSGTATYLDGAQPPRYSKVTVAGATAYWQESPSPGPGNSERLSSLKDGDVVTLTVMDLDPSQVERGTRRVPRPTLTTCGHAPAHPPRGGHLVPVWLRPSTEEVEELGLEVRIGGRLQLGVEHVRSTDHGVHRLQVGVRRRTDSSSSRSSAPTVRARSQVWTSRSIVTKVAMTSPAGMGPPDLGTRGRHHRVRSDRFDGPRRFRMPSGRPCLTERVGRTAGDAGDDAPAPVDEADDDVRGVDLHRATGLTTGRGPPRRALPATCGHHRGNDPGTSVIGRAYASTRSCGRESPDDVPTARRRRADALPARSPAARWRTRYPRQSSTRTEGRWTKRGIASRVILPGQVN